MTDFLVIVLDDRFCLSGCAGGDAAKFETERGGGETDGKIYVSIDDSNVDSGGYNGFLGRSFNRRFAGPDNWYCSVDHPFVPIIYFVNFVANLHVRKIISLIIVVIAVHIIGYSQK
ncbi:hypothetical protein BCR42DRAFT_398826 [Absidia repens]|uniref:Uncharacterized protein n=1 Tax=Absidia repens TaxID=90262 RepID=A0A1X2HR95_9FUNG|nr:hypothetical protein BCR42DRAFT_398826 [Absidia repens]